MKKTITINLCGRLYQIDEDANELLSQYIEALCSFFKKQEGGEEIADDIEERVAELFDDFKTQGIEAITIKHVQKVIHQIGQVDEIVGENSQGTGSFDDSGQADCSDRSYQARNPMDNRKFFRDSQNKILAGVLSGCAHYYGGSADIWRWGYVAVCVIWFFVLGVGPFSLTLPIEGIFGFFALPFTLMSLPFLILPLLPYFLIVIFTPEAKTPEDVLLMKGKEVNPQNLAAEVQEVTLLREKKKEGNDTTLWDIVMGVVSVGVSILLIIGFVVALCFFVAFLAAHELMADCWWNIDKTEDLQAITLPVIFCGIMLLVSIGVLLYCSIHAAASSFGKVPSMTILQRVVWFLLWVASVVGFVGGMVFAAGQLQKVKMASWENLQQEIEMAEDALSIPVDSISVPTDTLVISADSLVAATDSLSV